MFANTDACSRTRSTGQPEGRRLSRRGVTEMSRFDITDGDKAGQGERVGFAQALPTGVVHIQIDGYFSPRAAEFARIQIMAAIVDATKQQPGHQP